MARQLVVAYRLEEENSIECYETKGRDDVVVVRLPAEPSKITEGNHIEEPIAPESRITIDKNNFRFKIGHNQIRTFLIRF